MSLWSRTVQSVKRISSWRDVAYRLGGSQILDMSVPPTWNYESYLKAYGEIGWLFRGASVIAHTVAKEKWHLYKVDSQGEKKEVINHILIDLIKHVNPFQTWYEFMYLQTLYMVLVGEAFIVIDYEGGKRPKRMWSALPQRMEVKRDSADQYIGYYEYRVGANVTRLELEEVIHVKSPNPMNPLRGTGGGKALATDLGVEKYATRYQEKLFHNDAMPGLILEFPEMPMKETREELVEEWKKEHQGWQNARKTAFLWGGAKINTVTMNNRELDFWRTTNHRGQKILNVLGVPDVIAGKEGSYNKATAEVAKEIFASNTILPILTQVSESFNEQLIPVYPQPSGELLLGFDNPVPEDKEAKSKLANDGLTSGRITLNEARAKMGEDEVKDGDVFYVPSNVVVVPASKIGVARQAGPVITESKSNGKHLFTDEESKEEYWKLWVSKAEKQEYLLQEALINVFEKQRARMMGAYDELGADAYDKKQAVEEYLEVFKGYMPDVYEQAVREGYLLIHPEPAFRSKQDVIEPILNEDASKWLDTRMTWAAKEVGDELEKTLRGAIKTGFDQGESMDDIALRIQGVWDNCSEQRAIRIARTEVITASNVGARDGYKRAGIQFKEWYAAIDERVCEICAGLNGKVFRIDTGEMPPAHVMCRCTILPVLGGFE
ncbi:MAG: phage portal protein [Chloroflexota bacterium]|nr:phage portal protein [Chloroflexota bacterium]